MIKMGYKYLWIEIFWLIISAGTLSLFVSCVKEPPQTADNGDVSAKEMPVKFEVLLSMSGGTATLAGDYELSLTDNECRIERLVALLVTVDDSGNETDQWSYAEISYPGGYTGPTATFRMYTSPGKKHLYLVANMDPSRAVEAVFGNNSAVSTASGYEGVISDFLTLGTAEVGQNRPGSTIAMSGQAFIPGNSDPEEIVVQSSAPTSQIVTISGLQVTLTRCVAKVLFTCNMSSDKTGGTPGAKYVLIRDPQSTKNDPGDPSNANNDYNGWMDIRDVWFALNNTSRRLNVLPQTRRIGGADYVADPNYELSGFLQRVDGVYTPITENNVYGKNFVSFGPSELILPDAIDGIPFSSATCRMRALPYDAAKANSSDPANHYTEGLYCLENTVYNDLPDLSAAEAQSVPRMVSTYVVIVARYVPRYIYDDTLASTGTDISGQSYASYDDALAKLPAVSGEDEAGNSVIYPRGTFFYYHNGFQVRFCTYEGMMKWIDLTKGTLNPVTRQNFSVYKAGWGYYTTYIIGDQSNVPDEYGRRVLLFRDKDGVVRNTYYLLQASLFYVPGSNLPTDDLIMVNSKRLDWVPHGQSDEMVRPR